MVRAACPRRGRTLPDRSPSATNRPGRPSPNPGNRPRRGTTACLPHLPGLRRAEAATRHALSARLETGRPADGHPLLLRLAQGAAGSARQPPAARRQAREARTARGQSRAGCESRALLRRVRRTRIRLHEGRVSHAREGRRPARRGHRGRHERHPLGPGPRRLAGHRPGPSRGRGRLLRRLPRREPVRLRGAISRGGPMLPSRHGPMRSSSTRRWWTGSKWGACRRVSWSCSAATRSGREDIPPRGAGGRIARRRS